MSDQAPPVRVAGTGRSPGGRVVRLDVTAAAATAPGPTRRAPGPGPGAGTTGGQSRLVQLCRGCVAAQLVAVGCGLVGADYVESAYFGLILPALSGLACGWALSRGARQCTQRLLTPLAMIYGGASAAVAFVYAGTPYGSVGTWLPPLLCAGAGAIAWPWVDPSPRR